MVNSGLHRGRNQWEPGASCRLDTKNREVVPKNGKGKKGGRREKEGRRERGKEKRKRKKKRGRRERGRERRKNSIKIRTFFCFCFFALELFTTIFFVRVTFFQTSFKNPPSWYRNWETS